MKTLLAIVISFICLENTNAQTVPLGNNEEDTLAYLKTFKARKAEYIGKPFSVLLADLKIPIKAFSPIGGIFTDRSKEDATAFFFKVPTTFDDFSSGKIVIYWQECFNINISDIIYNKSEEGGIWLPEDMQYYKNVIIGDMWV